MTDRAATNIKTDSLAFKNHKVFTMQDEILGLPASVFIVGLGLSVSLAVMLFWWMLFVTSLLYFPPMYHIHKDDPRGLKVWIRALQRRHTYWRAGRASARQLVIFSRSGV